MDEKINSMKKEIMLQLQEKIDQALSEIDDNTDRSDQIDSIKSNIQGTILRRKFVKIAASDKRECYKIILVEIMVLKSQLEDQIKNQTSNIAMDIETIIGKGLVTLISETARFQRVYLMLIWCSSSCAGFSRMQCDVFHRPMNHIEFLFDHKKLQTEKVVCRKLKKEWKTRTKILKKSKNHCQNRKK